MQLKEALDISLEYENKVRDHYANGAKLINDPAGKRIFEVLAREEQGHVDYLVRQQALLQGQGGEAVALQTFIPPEWVVEARKKLKSTPGKRVAEKSDLELVKLALQLELDTSAFYRSLMEKLPVQDREFFRPFMAIEDGHVDIVQAELDSLQGLGYWFDMPEFNLEAG